MTINPLNVAFNVCVGIVTGEWYYVIGIRILAPILFYIHVRQDLT